MERDEQWMGCVVKAKNPKKLLKSVHPLTHSAKGKRRP
jgi:hypothetical protein